MTNKSTDENSRERGYIINRFSLEVNQSLKYKQTNVLINRQTCRQTDRQTHGSRTNYLAAVPFILIFTVCIDVENKRQTDRQTDSRHGCGYEVLH